MSERFSPEQQQLLALAAVFEAAQLADDVAQRGDCDPNIDWRRHATTGFGLCGANPRCFVRYA